MPAFLAGVVAALASLVCAGCVALPESGPVETGRAVAGQEIGDAPYFSPPPPLTGATPAQLAAGFIRAMEANPVTTAVARGYLTSEAARAWRPDRATIVYSSFTVLPAAGSEADGVEIVLSDARRLDRRGAWEGTTGAGEETLRIPVARESGEWRITDPPDALIVPETFFRARFERVALYYFDPSLQVLVPQIVYVPGGDQMATRLVRGLLEGPRPGADDGLRTLLPPGMDVELSVPVTRGRAEISLVSTGGVRAQPDLDAEATKLLAAQLSWTLRQVPEVDRVSVLVDDTPLTFPGGATEVPVTYGADFDPAVLWASRSLFGVRDDLVVELVDGRERPVTGWFGENPGSYRSLGVSLAGGDVAAVTADGSRMLLGAAQRSAGSADPAPPAQVAGVEFLPPAWDHQRTLWLVDRRAAGARVLAGRPSGGAGGLAPVDVPGISGEDVVAFLVSRDGSRLVAAIDGPAGTPDRVVVARLVRDAQGSVVDARPARALESVGAAGLTDVVDLGWVTPTTIAVLDRPADGVSHVHVGPFDGSTGVGEETFAPRVFRNVAQGLVTAPTPGVPLLLDSAEGQLYQVSSAGRWSLADLGSGVGLPTFVG
ncbi:LpqB family beta-propeller domain-containing protein [Nocardioides massiliensis]|nr:LpqB family beta-propeller domain-containing protein [Nocardioides massiliensis]